MINNKTCRNNLIATLRRSDKWYEGIFPSTGVSLDKKTQSLDYDEKDQYINRGLQNKGTQGSPLKAIQVHGGKTCKFAIYQGSISWTPTIVKGYVVSQNNIQKYLYKYKWQHLWYSVAQAWEVNMANHPFMHRLWRKIMTRLN